jgi:polygalacturonase
VAKAADAGGEARRPNLGAATLDPARDITAELAIPASRVFDVRFYGATGDGATIDSGAINRAIGAASRAGGGTVWFPPGTYMSYSIRLQSRIRLYLEAGAVILAAEPPARPGAADGYDVAEDSLASRFPYQDFGHSHWRNSLISGIGLENIAIEGRGLIWGKGLVNGDFEPRHLPAMQPGVGNKAIALFGCKNVILRDIAILEAGHFAVLATGTGNIRLEGLTIDTNRDGLNLDCCRGVRVVGCRINSPSDDAICLKSTYALGERVLTEDVFIGDCRLTGCYRLGSVLDGTYRLLGDGHEARANVTHRTGRIKLGTESLGGFRSIVMENNTVRGARGIALETVDGGVLEDVRIRGLTMRDVRNAPIFIRLGARLNGPPGTVPGRLRNISISEVDCDQIHTAMPMIISGIPGHRIEGVEMRHIHLRMRGGGTGRMAAILPPEAVRSYPDPEAFGVDLPACGLLARHVRGLTVKDVTLDCARPDKRAAVWLQDVLQGAVFIDRTRGVRAKSVFEAVDTIRGMTVRAPGERPVPLSRLPRPGRRPVHDRPDPRSP